MSEQSVKTQLSSNMFPHFVRIQKVILENKCTRFLRSHAAEKEGKSDFLPQFAENFTPYGFQ